MPINSKAIQFLILIYPFFYAIPYVSFVLGYRFSIYYFFPLTLIFIFLNFGKKSLKRLKQEKTNLLLLLAILIIILINFTTIHYTKPLLFIIFVINFYLLRLTLILKENKRAVLFTIMAFLLFSVLFLFDSSRYANENRYSSFLISPTVYSVYAEVFLIIALFHLKKWYLYVLAFLITGTIILSTETRLNFLFLLLLPLLWYLVKNYHQYKLIIFVGFIIGLNLLYPIYSVVVESSFGKEVIVESRYEDGRDNSFYLRSYLNKMTYEDYYKNSTGEKLFGKGAEEARKLVIEKVGQDIFTHNDFIRFTYDFGVITTILLMIFFYRVSRKNKVSFLLLFLYLFAFYHNMIYDFFIVALLLFYGGIKEKNNVIHTINNTQIEDDKG